MPQETAESQPKNKSHLKKYLFFLAGISMVLIIAVTVFVLFKKNTWVSNKTANEEAAITAPENSLLDLQNERIIYNYDDCSVFLSNFDGTKKTDLNVDFKYPFCGIAPNGNYYYYFGKADETHRQLCFHEIADKADKKDFCVEKSTNTDSATEQFFDISWSPDGKFIVWRNDPIGISFKIANVTEPSVLPFANENGICQSYSWFPLSDRLFCFGEGKFRTIDAEKFVSSGGKGGIKDFQLPAGMKKIENNLFSETSPDINFNSLSCGFAAISENMEKIACNQAINLIQSELDDVFFVADLKKREYISGQEFDSGFFRFSPGGNFLVFSDWSVIFGDEEANKQKNVLDVTDLGSTPNVKYYHLPYYGKAGAGSDNMLFSAGYGIIPNIYKKNSYQLNLSQKFALDAITTEKYAEENGLITAKDQSATSVEINDPASQIKFNIPQNIFSAEREVKQVMWDQKTQDQEQWTITSNRNKLIFLVIGINKTRDTIDSVLKSYKEFDPNAQKIEMGGKTWIKASNEIPIYATVYNGLQVGCSLAGEALSSPEAQKIAEDIISSIWIK